MTFKTTIKHIAAATALLASLCAATPALADINATATTSGSANAYTLVARITPDAQYVGRGKLFFVVQHGAQLYVLSETRGFIPYAAGEPAEYRTISQATETITVQGWNTTAQPGAAIFVGYGNDATDMLSNGKFKLVATLPQAPAPITPVTPVTPPVSTNPYAVHNGAYMCYDDYGRSGAVTGTFTANSATVDTSRLTTIPVNSYSLSVSTVVSVAGTTIYNNLSFPLRMAGLDMTRSGTYSLVVVYQASEFSTQIMYACAKR